MSFIITMPNKKIMHNAAKIDSPAPERLASVKSLGIFLQSCSRRAGDKKKSHNFESSYILARRNKNSFIFFAVLNCWMLKYGKCESLDV